MIELVITQSIRQATVEIVDIASVQLPAEFPVAVGEDAKFPSLILQILQLCFEYGLDALGEDLQS